MPIVLQENKYTFGSSVDTEKQASKLYQIAAIPQTFFITEKTMNKNNRRSFLLEPPQSPLPAGLAFLRQARFRLREDYWVKITAALAQLSDEQVWWRPNQASNSIGNLILHLAGNARQWIIAGVGGAADTRQRAAEFAAREGIGKEELIALLSEVLDEVDIVLAGLEDELTAAQSDAPLQRECTPQGFAQTVFDAVFHVVEHFSYHTGQIIQLAKWQAAEGLRLYDDRQLNPQAGRA